jgi:hypothetical protein
VSSQVASEPKPKCGFCRLAVEYTQRRSSREKGRSSSLPVTMYWRSSGPNDSSR